MSGFLLVNRADELLAVMCGEEVTDVILGFQGEVLAAQVDEIFPVRIHVQKLLHAAQFGVDKAVAAPQGVARLQDSDVLIRL